MPKFTKTETIYAEQWDGSDGRANELMAELAHHGITSHYHGAFKDNKTQVPIVAMISFPGYHIHPTDYLVKEYLTEDSICWSVKSARQMASYTEEKG